jgi:hypothetical protein
MALIGGITTIAALIATAYEMRMGKINTVTTIAILLGVMQLVLYVSGTSLFNPVGSAIVVIGIINGAAFGILLVALTMQITLFRLTAATACLTTLAYIASCLM